MGEDTIERCTQRAEIEGCSSKLLSLSLARPLRHHVGHLLCSSHESSLLGAVHRMKDVSSSLHLAVCAEAFVSVKVKAHTQKDAGPPQQRVPTRADANAGTKTGSATKDARVFLFSTTTEAE